MVAVCSSRRKVLCLLGIYLVAAISLLPVCDAFGVSRLPFRTISRHAVPTITTLREAPAGSDDPATVQKAPTLNGKMVLPYKVMSVGLKGHEVAAVYAVLNSQYKRGSGDAWEHCEYVGVTRNLDEALQLHLGEHGADVVAHVRALSFSFPQIDAMQEVASQWRQQAVDAGGNVADWNKLEIDGSNDAAAEERAALVDLMERTAYYDDDDDDEFEFDDEEDDMMVKNGSSLSEASDTIVSPFESASEEAPPAPTTGDKLEFTAENVDKILEEVRPYLISDGGNVAVQGVDVDKKNVYLLLEGACGSCPSSTVTMQMGIERVLKENYPDLGEVIQVEDPATAAAKPTELTYEAVELEVNRIKPAIMAMGGVVEIVKVDPIGVVELKFHGSNKVRQGLELALRDVEFVKHVNFVM